jgi:phosphatidylethanolamine/phosphatidyl-N-methylethanolamine N-methyltransferase
MRHRALRSERLDLDSPAPVSDSMPPIARRRELQWHFLRQWVRHPLRTASMLPSSRALARLMVSEIGPHTVPVVELGAGTGALTQEILRAGVAPRDLIVVELNPHFAELLQNEYPEITVIAGSAEHLPRFVDPASVGAVISSLPMVVMTPGQQRRIVASSFEALRPGAHFYQFTYGHRCPVSRRVMSTLDLATCCVGGTLRNLPPARVFRLTRANEVAPAPRRRFLRVAT